MVSDSHLFSTSRQMNRTVKKKERKKKSNLKIVSPPLCMHVRLFLPLRDKGHTSRAFYYPARESHVPVHRNRT